MDLAIGKVLCGEPAKLMVEWSGWRGEWFSMWERTRTKSGSKPAALKPKAPAANTHDNLSGWMEDVAPKKDHHRKRNPKDQTEPHKANRPRRTSVLLSEFRVLSVVKEPTKEKNPLMTETGHADPDHQIDEGESDQSDNTQVK